MGAYRSPIPRAWLIAALAVVLVCCVQPSHGRVTVGIETLQKSGFKELLGRRVGILTNPTAVFPETLEHVVDYIHDNAPAVRLSAIFGPEHGFRGDHQDGESGGTFVDPRTGITVYDTYGKRGDALAKIVRFSGVDLVIFDIQDVGVRFYTYIWSMWDMMQACAANDVQFMVLDRPNPIGATVTAGPVLDPKYASGVGRLPIALIHGMTVAELARMFNDVHADKKVNLTVVLMGGYRRDMMYADTGLPWVMPSPNMPTADTARVYPGLGMIEGTTMSEGRGTTRPFEISGAPFIANCTFHSLAHELSRRIAPAAARFRDVFFIPTHNKHAGKLCLGVQVYPGDNARFNPVAVAVHYFHALYQGCPGTQVPWRADGFINLLTGSTLLRTMLDAGAAPDAILQAMQKDMPAFNAARARYLAY